MIEGRSHDSTEQDGEDHVDKIETYHKAQDKSRAVDIKENDINQSESEEYCWLQTDIKEVIEREDKVKEQTSNLRIENLESAEQCNEGYLSILETKKERQIESMERNRDDNFNETEIYYDTRGELQVDFEKEMDDSNEDNVNSTESTEQQNKRHVRKLGIINERSSESR